ncbi:MAG: hypothetical protein AAGK02_13195 [Pseudomonadota bacterium]
MGSFGWIEIVLFYGIAIGFALQQYFSMDRKIKRAKEEKARADAENAAKTETE